MILRLKLMYVLSKDSIRYLPHKKHDVFALDITIIYLSRSKESQRCMNCKKAHPFTLCAKFRVFRVRPGGMYCNQRDIKSSVSK